MRNVLYIFGLLTDGDMEWLAANGVRRFLADGEVVMREGEHSDALILVLSGRLRVSTRDGGEIAQLGVGELVGEISLVDSAPPSATVTTLGAGDVLVIDKWLLIGKLGRDDSFAARIYHALAILLADRLRATSRGRTGRLAGTEIADDELDERIIDRLSAAGERFNRLLRIVGGEARAPAAPSRRSS